MKKLRGAALPGADASDSLRKKIVTTALYLVPKQAIVYERKSVTAAPYLAPQ